MPSRMIPTRPTKIELIKLRRRLSLALRIQKLVKDRLSILVMEFMQIAKENVTVRKRLFDIFSETYRSLSITAGYHGYIALEKELMATERDVTVASGSRNVAGVRTPSFEISGAGKPTAAYNLVDTSSWVDKTAQLSHKCLEAIVELAELQSGFELLGREINRTKRIVNALEYRIIPRLQTTIKYLHMKFEERDREEKSRLKRVKMILQRK